MSLPDFWILRHGKRVARRVVLEARLSGLALILTLCEGPRIRVDFPNETGKRNITKRKENAGNRPISPTPFLVNRLLKGFDIEDCGVC